MSNHNYSQYSKKNTPVTEPEIEAVVNETVIQDHIIAEAPAEVAEVKMESAHAVEPEAKPEKVTGKVANCAKLNVRAKADAAATVVCVLDAATEVTIDVEKSTEEWFKVCTANGAEGFCMRKFITANL